MKNLFFEFDLYQPETAKVDVKGSINMLIKIVFRKSSHY